MLIDNITCYWQQRSKVEFNLKTSYLHNKNDKLSQ